MKLEVLILGHNPRSRGETFQSGSCGDGLIRGLGVGFREFGLGSATLVTLATFLGVGICGLGVRICVPVGGTVGAEGILGGLGPLLCISLLLPHAVQLLLHC